MPIIRSLRLYRSSQQVAHNLGYSWSLVWCKVVGYASGLRDVALSGTIIPIIGSLRLHRCSQHVAHDLGYSGSLVWCDAVGYASGVRDVA